MREALDPSTFGELAEARALSPSAEARQTIAHNTRHECKCHVHGLSSGKWAAPSCDIASVEELDKANELRKLKVKNA